MGINKDCNQCSKKIISEPRCISWGGTFNRLIESVEKLNYSIDYMFIGQNPWFNHKKNKTNLYERAFGNLSEKILIKYLTKHHFNFSKIWITNAVLCSVIDNNPYLIEDAFVNCKENLLKEIEDVKPKILVLLGNLTTKLITKVYNLQIPTFKMYHPNALSYNSKLSSNYDKQFQILKKMI